MGMSSKHFHYECILNKCVNVSLKIELNRIELSGLKESGKKIMDGTNSGSGSIRIHSGNH